MYLNPSFLRFLAFCACLLSLTVAAGQRRSLTTLHTDWKFALGPQPQGAAPTLDDSGWEAVTVPHDWAISQPFIVEGDGNTGKLPWRGEGWYRHRLTVPAASAGQRFYLIFDGVMAFPQVFVNGQLAGSWDYGYNSFYLDVTELIRPGQPNLLAVHADTRPHDSRWYPGAGLYRKVQLLTVDPVHVDVWGTQVTTPIVKPHYADVRIRTRVNNHSGQTDSLQVSQQILSPAGEVVAEGSRKQLVRAGQQKLVELTLTLRQPRRWDIDDPALYTVVTTLAVNGQARDRYETPFGVRTIRFDPDHGFYLNDRRVQLKGVNLHHDHGPLGAAFYPRAMERQLEIMQEMGVNAIRNSHNIAAPELLALCDRMGLLVFNEAFDKYDAKAGILDTTSFEAFAARNLRNFVRRDRNHPSVIIWSVGNEIGDVQWNLNGGFYRLNVMVNQVRRYDATRPVTLVNNETGSAALRHFDYYDLHCYNYSRRYRLARQLEPNEAVIISESSSTVSTRGFYEFPLPTDPTAFTRSLQVSSYDLNAPWWAEVPDDDFMWQQEEPYIAGEFVWTGFDYLGEPTPYANDWVKEMGFGDENASRSSYFGIVDLVGLPKDRFFLYQSYWKPKDTTIHILPHWNWPERVGEKVPVFVYTQGDCGELFVNGRSQGKQCKDPKADSSLYRFRLMWPEVVYEPGSLEVVVYQEGKILGKKQLVTAGEPAQLRLTVDRKSLKADGMDLAYVRVEAVDGDGNLAPWAEHSLQLMVKGAGSLAGAGNGDPQSFAPLQDETVELFYGQAMVILRSGYQAGKLHLAVKAKGLPQAEVEVEVEE